MRKVGICKPDEKDYQIVYSQADTIIAEFTLGELLNAIKRGKIIDNMSIQRDANQWSNKDKSLLIHTILINLSILPISLTQKGTGAGAIKLLIDGKQRLSTCMQFKDNEFPLHKDTPPVLMQRVVKKQKIDSEGQPMFEKVGRKKSPIMIPCLDEVGEPLIETIEYNVAGKFYDELPDDLKVQFDTYSGMKQLTHVNYTEEEYQTQMLRDNISAKMTPAQTGIVLCGEELATWLHSFRYENLFLNGSTWSEKQVCKSLIERCVVESFILGNLDGRWYKRYEQNVELFKAHAMSNVLEDYKEKVAMLGKILYDIPEIKERLTNKNMNIIIAAYLYFKDMETAYDDNDFGRFLCKWFEEIKDTTEYEIEGNTGTKLKQTVVGKLNIINEQCEKYMREYGTIVDNNEEVDDKKTNNLEPKDKEIENKNVCDLENELLSVIGIEDEQERNVFNIKTMMISSEYHYGDFKEGTLKDFEKYFKSLSLDEQVDLIDNAEYYSSCLYDYLMDIDRNSGFINEDNVLCLLNIVKRVNEEDIPESVFIEWIKMFATEYDNDDVYCNISEGQDNYIMGRISYLYGSLEKFQVEYDEYKE